MNPAGSARPTATIATALTIVAALVADTPVARGASDTAVQLTNTGAAATAYLRIPNHADFAMQSFTLEAWVQRAGIGYGFSTDAMGASIIAKPTENVIGSNLGSWNVTYNNSGQALFNVVHTFSTSGIFIQSPTLPDPLGRHHLAATFDGDSARVFVDGVQRASGVWTLGAVAYGTQDVLIGASNFAVGYLRRFDGKIDDVRVWNRARSEAEIAATMNCRLSGSEDGLVAYYPFDASTLVDATGHGHDGAVDGLAGSLAYVSMAPLSDCLVDVPSAAVQTGLELACFPSPAHDALAVRFSLPRTAPVRLDLYDVSGRRMKTIDAGQFAAGEHRLPIDVDLRAALGTRAGVYFLRLTAGDQVVVRSLVRLP